LQSGLQGVGPTSQVGYDYGACGVAFKKEQVTQVKKSMIMELVERHSRRNRTIKSGRLSIKRGGEQDQEGTGQSRQDLRTENSRVGSGI
jgi:hypothetical protein